LRDCGALLAERGAGRGWQRGYCLLRRGTVLCFLDVTFCGSGLFGCGHRLYLPLLRVGGEDVDHGAVEGAEVVGAKARVGWLLEMGRAELARALGQK
jgi:hypothetical protein